MPPQQPNLTSETERDAGAPGRVASIAAAKQTIDHASAPTGPKVPVVVFGGAVSDTDGAGPARSILDFLKRIFDTFQQRSERRRLRASLCWLSERELRDIGIAPGEIEAIAARQALERLRDGTAYLFRDGM